MARTKLHRLQAWRKQGREPSGWIHLEYINTIFKNLAQETLLFFCISLYKFFLSISKIFRFYFHNMHIKAISSLWERTTFCRCIMFSKSPNGDSSGLSKASRASVRSISVRHSLLSSPCSANWVWANSRAASVSRCRISSIKCCCYTRKTQQY